MGNHSREKHNLLWYPVYLMKLEAFEWLVKEKGFQQIKKKHEQLHRIFNLMNVLHTHKEAVWRSAEKTN